MPSKNTKSKRPVVRRTSPPSCSVSRWPEVWKFIASCVDYYADMIEINVKSERREMTPDERWTHGLARGNAKSLLDETQKPNLGLTGHGTLCRVRSSPLLDSPN